MTYYVKPAVYAGDSCWAVYDANDELMATGFISRKQAEEMAMGCELVDIELAKAEELGYVKRVYFAEAFRAHRFRIPRSSECLICREATSPADLDRALDDALARLQ